MDAIRKLLRFAGIIIVVVAGAWVLYGNYQDGVKTKEYFAAPMVEDIYFADMLKVPGSGFEPKGMSNVYSVMKLVSIEGDKHTFITAMEGYDKKKGIRKDMDGGKVRYDKENPITFSDVELKGLFDADVIYEIRRSASSK